MANQEGNWKKETVKAAVPVVLLWASAGAILWVAISAQKQNEAPSPAPRVWKPY